MPAKGSWAAMRTQVNMARTALERPADEKLADAMLQIDELQKENVQQRREIDDLRRQLPVKEEVRDRQV
jgi:Tfp pilus assembly protein PilO